MNAGTLYTSESDAIVRLEAKRLLACFVFRTGENYADDGPDVSEATYRPHVVHLGQYVSNGSVGFSPHEGVTVLIDPDFQADPLFRDQLHP